jgi:hypothetical protein
VPDRIEGKKTEKQRMIGMTGRRAKMIRMIHVPMFPYLKEFSRSFPISIDFTVLSLGSGK